METRIIKYINAFAIMLPLMVALTFPFFGVGSILYAILSIAATGFIQFCLAIKMLADNSKDLAVYAYILGVAMFLILWLRNHIVGYDNFLTVVLVPAPFFLSFYLSFLIYFKR